MNKAHEKCAKDLLDEAKTNPMKTIICECGFICLDVEGFKYCPKCGEILEKS